MALNLYSLTLPSGGQTLSDGLNGRYALAGNAADAKAVAEHNLLGDGNGLWAGATASAALADDLTIVGLKLRCTITADGTNTFPADFVLEHLIVTGEETADLASAAFLIELNATTELSGVTYTSGTDTFDFAPSTNVASSVISIDTLMLGADGVWFPVTDKKPVTTAATVLMTKLDTGRRPSLAPGGFRA